MHGEIRRVSMLTHPRGDLVELLRHLFPRPVEVLARELCEELELVAFLEEVPPPLDLEVEIMLTKQRSTIQSCGTKA